jgi:hypothetical protein
MSPNTPKKSYAFSMDNTSEKTAYICMHIIWEINRSMGGWGFAAAGPQNYRIGIREVSARLGTMSR